VAGDFKGEQVMGANYQKQMADRVSGMAYAYDYAVKHGLDALKKELQFRRATYMQDDGKYIRKLKGEKKRGIRKKLRRWSQAVKSGKMSERKFYGKYEAWKKHALQGNCIKLCHSMDLYVEELMK